MLLPDGESLNSPRSGALFTYISTVKLRGALRSPPPFLTTPTQAETEQYSETLTFTDADT